MQPVDYESASVILLQYSEFYDSIPGSDPASHTALVERFLAGRAANAKPAVEGVPQAEPLAGATAH